VRNVTELACRKALYHRGVAHLNFPVDLQDQSSNGIETERAKPCVAVDAHGARMPTEGI